MEATGEELLFAEFLLNKLPKLVCIGIREEHNLVIVGWEEGKTS
jgi:hypothetical protein